ncbi:MAG: hypothetical protein Kow0069_08090 [Promethearchaeota archaeon]
MRPEGTAKADARATSPLRDVVGDVAAVLLHPREVARRSLEANAHSGGTGTAFAAYVASTNALAQWFFTYYPEPLFYGTSASLLRENLPSVVLPNPLAFLAVVAAACFLLQVFLGYWLVGRLTHRHLSRRFPGSAPPLGSFMGVHALTLSPWLLLVPVVTVRFVFFERLVFLKPDVPPWDWTLPNVAYFSALGAVFAWSLVLQVRVNQAAFGAPRSRAALPAALQAAVVAVVSFLAPLAGGLVFEAFKEGLT